MRHLPDCDWHGEQGCTCADRIFWDTASDDEREQITKMRRAVPEWAGRMLR